VEKDKAVEKSDVVAVEEPLEIRIMFGPVENRKSRSLSVTMRTPGHDLELAAGFLVSEGIVSQPDHIIGNRFTGLVPAGEERANTIEVELSTAVSFELQKIQRHFYTTSSCGICGKTSLDAIRADNVQHIEADFETSTDVIHGLPDLLRQHQNVFAKTGGLHAAGLATLQGDMIESREDVGRHNAVDKLIGSQLIAGSFPLTDRILILSGRASFELMQKALLAAIPLVVAVGAPSSLAVELATEFNMTLIGFTSRDRFNIYAGRERVKTI
jgi:FdhD protein